MEMRHLRRPIHLILDWDGTLTAKDTLSLVGQIGYSHSKTQPSSLPPWSDFVNAYGTDFSDHMAKYEPKAHARTTLEQERHWLASLAPIENRSVRRVEASKIFQGVKAVDVDTVARTALQDGSLKLRNHWDILFQKLLSGDDDAAAAQQTPNKISILSVNWSERFIRQSLLLAAPETTNPKSTDPKSYIQDMEIRANEITGLEHPDGSDGTLNKKDSNGIRTSADKLSYFPPSHRKNLDVDARETVKHGHDHTVVYVGDSATDLESLIAADLGICMRDEPMGSSQRELAETLRRIGFSVVSVEEGVQEGDRVVYWASDYTQIARFMGL